MAYQQFTLANLRTFVTSRLQNPLFWSDLEVQVAINDSIRSWQLATAYWQGRFQVTTIAGQVLYNIGSLPQLQVGGVTQLLMPLRMTFNGLPIDPVTTDDLDNGYTQAPGWQITTTATSGAPSTPSLWVPIGISYFAIYPADAAGNNQLTIDGVLRAPTLVNEGDYINIDSSQVAAIVGEAISTLSFKRGGVAFQKALAGHAEFMRACLAMNSHLYAASPFRGYWGLDKSRNTRRRDTVSPVGTGFR